MKTEIKYIEQKTGYSDNGPAWIGKVKLSSSGQTVYFNDKGFKKCRGISGNYYDIETQDEYWISGVKKDGTDRHWAGSGKIFIDKSVISEYLEIIDKDELDVKKFVVIDIPDTYPIERITSLENSKKS